MQSIKCSLDKRRQDKVNLDRSENDQKWQGGRGDAEARWASRGGSSDEMNAREGGRGVRRVRTVGVNEG